jgi:integrase/recombinase XerC
MDAGSMVDSFLKYLQYEKRVSPNTISAYQNDLEQFTAFLSENFPDDQIEAADYHLVRAWIIQLVEENIQASSVNRKIACLRTFYKFLMRQEVISKDPMFKIRVLKARKKLPSFIKEGDMIQVLDNLSFENTLESWREKLVLELFYGTGIRLSELLTLKERDVDLRSRTIKVLGKRNKERVIPFAINLVSIIEEYRNVRNREVKKEDHELLLVTDKGEPCYPMMVYRIVKDHLVKHSSVEKKSPHVLRHTYATHLLNKGAEINAVKDLLGHTSLAATQVYTHNSMEKLKKIFDQAHPKA